MAARDPLLDKFAEIPDPAASVSAPGEARPVPEASPPTESSPTRSARRVRAAVAVVVALLWIGVIFRDLGARKDLHAVEVAVPLLVWTLSAAVALLFIFRRGERGLPAGVRVAQIAAVGLPFLFLTVAALAARGGQHAPFTWSGALPCMLWSSIACAGPVVVAALLLRRSFLSAPVWRGAAVGAVLGLGATITIHAHCPATGGSHVLVAHGFSIVTGAIVGALLGALGGRA
jgi:hypothetical protein